jgi:type II secretory pathway component HofQ
MQLRSGRVVTLLGALLIGSGAAGGVLAHASANVVAAKADGAAPAPSPQVIPPAPAPAAEIRRSETGEPLITNIFAETDMRQALSDIANQAGVVIIPDATVQGTVSADLRDVPFEKALNMVLVSGGYVFRQMDGYYLVGAPDPANPNLYLLSEAEVVELSYMDSNAIAAYLAGPYGRFVTVEGAPVPEPERDMQARNRTQTAYQRPAAARGQAGGTRLFITAPRAIIERIKSDLALIDRPRTQVMLEAVVIEVTEDALKEVGIDWATRWTRFASQASGIPIGGTSQLGNQNTLTLPTSSLTYSELSFTELAQLTALVQKGKARLRANPRIATTEGQPAEIEVGQEKYFAIVTGPVTFPYTTLEQIASGITLRITPTVVEKTREVIARVEPDVRDVTGSGANGLPEITYRRAVTNVRVKDGQSIVIGGLTSEFTTRTASKFPILGDIPLIGNLFRRVSSRQTKSEVVIIITPHILGEDGTYSGQEPARP